MYILNFQIPAELISMDNSILGDVDTETLQKARDQKPKYVKKADIELKHRIRRKNAKVPKIKEMLRTERNMNIEKSSSTQDDDNKDDVSMELAPTEQKSDDPLARFAKKKKTARYFN